MMSRQRILVTPITVLPLLIGLILSISFGGCPVQQQPRVPDNQTDEDARRPPSINNERDSNRPIPPPAIDEGDDDSGEGGGIGGGDFLIPDAGSVSQPVFVVIAAPDASDINILPGGEGAVTYEVLGGDPEDGVIKVQLFYDVDGVADTGDEIVLETDLAPRGTEAFIAAGIAPGSYHIGIRASNNKEIATAYANGRLVVVGRPLLRFTQPSGSVRVRPNTGVSVQFTIESLARTVSYAVFTDTDTVVNGNEVEAFTGGGLNGTGTIFLTDFDDGRYFIGVSVADSVGQEQTEYIGVAEGSPRTITVDLAPSVQVTDPATNLLIVRGEPVAVTIIARDPEASAVVTVFRDSDGVFNGNEATLATYQLTTPEHTFSDVIDTSALAPGRYKLGAAINDGIGGSIASYSAGGFRINAPAVVEIIAPLADRQVRAGEAVTLRWNVQDLENHVISVSWIQALDADGDRMPDAGTEIITATNLGVGVGSIQFETVAKKAGRYMLGVRVVDDANAVTTSFAPGIITLLNDTPTSFFRAPTTDNAVRPGAAIFMDFDVTDPERGLKLPPDGIQVILVESDASGEPIDQNGDGVIDDADIIYSETDPFFNGSFPNTHFFDTGVVVLAGLLDPNGNGIYRLGVRAEDLAANVSLTFAPGVLTVDSVVPEIELIAPGFMPPDQTLRLDKIDSLLLELQIRDTSRVTFAVFLDRNLEPQEGDELLLVAEQWTPGEPDPVITIDPLTNFPSGLFFFYVVVRDGVAPAVAFYSPIEGDQEEPDQLTKLRIRDRINGTIHVADLETSPNGAILQGFNFNDQGGSAMASVPDLNGDGINEFVIVSRFGKPFIVNSAGIGFGEAYLAYGNSRRLSGATSLNAVGRGAIAGLAFPGIRVPLNTTWTGGMSDVAVVSDMDGDELPELIFSFPRVESLNLGVRDLNYQHPELFPDVIGIGNLEYNALTPNGWEPNRAQFTRGGIVIVSSHNALIQDEALRNRKFDRIIDLHEVGQLFDGHARATLVPYIKDVIRRSPVPRCRDCDRDPKTNACDPLLGAEVFVEQWSILWDVVMDNQGPGGFHQPWTQTPADPPLANPSEFPWTLGRIAQIYPQLRACQAISGGIGCETFNLWYRWGACPSDPFPCTAVCGLESWNVGGCISVWTGFYGPASAPFRDPASGEYSTIGARVLGQAGDDRFGTAIASDGTWLYISAPLHTVTQPDVPSLPDPSGQRKNSGVVYQYRVDTRPTAGAPTLSQLWIEPEQVYPTPDFELELRTDFTMPVPHQYIIETVGSTRGRSTGGSYSAGGGCPPAYSAGGGAQADAAQDCYVVDYVPGTAGFYADRTPQIVGPASGAKLSYVRAVGDVNDDGLRDFVVGSREVRNANGERVGAVFIVHSRATGLEGDYLLERMAFRPGDPLRQNGVLIVGTRDADISRAFDEAGDFNGDGVDDVLVGSEHGFGDAGEAILVLGSVTLVSPQDGYTIAQIVDDRRAIRFAGVRPGDLTGANVAAAGDVDGDGFGDILIAAPNAVDPAQAPGNPDPGPGVVYLIYGSSTLVGGDTVDLSRVGTVDVKGIVFVGRNIGDLLGGGSKTVSGTDPNGGSTTSFSRGVTALGDIDGDRRADFAISAMLADPFGKTDAGEVYIFYGRGDLLGGP